jgi:hypothetical protein
MTNPGPGAGLDLNPADLVLRRVPSAWIVDSEDGPRASSQAFSNGRNDESMSGYLDSLLLDHGLTRGQILEDHEPGMFFVAALTVDFLRNHGQTVEPDPIEPIEHVCDPAHVVVIGRKPTKLRSRLAKGARWVPGLGPVGGPTLDH